MIVFIYYILNKIEKIRTKNNIKPNYLNYFYDPYHKILYYDNLTQEVNKISKKKLLSSTDTHSDNVGTMIYQLIRFTSGAYAQTTEYLLFKKKRHQY